MKSLLLAIVIGAGFTACNKDTEIKAANPCAANPCAANPCGANPCAAKDAMTEEFIHVLAAHTDPTKQAGDPVVVNFPDYQVESADFNPADLTGGSVKLTVSIGSLKSGVDARDKHLNAADLLDSANFASAIVSVSDIAKKEDMHYAGKMTIEYRGKITQTDIEFKQLGAQEDRALVHLKAPLSLSDFGVGNAGGAISSDLTLEAKVWIQKK